MKAEVLNIHDLDRINVYITTKCSLRCKECAALIPYFPNPTDCDVSVTMVSLKSFFAVVNKVKTIIIGGGEPFCAKNISDFISRIFSECADNFENLKIITNASILPSQETMELIIMNRDKINITVDNYGSLSLKFEQILLLFDNNKITYDVHNYDDEQYCGGWVKLGPYEDRKYTGTRLKKVYETCRNRTLCSSIVNSRLYVCCTQASLNEIGIIKCKEGEFVDLLSGADDLELEKKIERSLVKIIPNACRYCSGFNVEEGERLQAAEQLKSPKKL
jgi:molybdenum cofactor biosynthesis enzyme MoaA